MRAERIILHDAAPGGVEVVDGVRTKVVDDVSNLDNSATQIFELLVVQQSGLMDVWNVRLLPPRQYRNLVLNGIEFASQYRGIKSRL